MWGPRRGSHSTASSSSLMLVLVVFFQILLRAPTPSGQLVMRAGAALWFTGKNLNNLGIYNFTRRPVGDESPGKNVTLRVAVEEWVPHVKVTDRGNGTFTIQGPMANLLSSLATYLNFRYTLVRPPDGAWGAPDANGNWNGMIGMVRRNEADIALGPFGLTETRAKVVHFSQPIMIDYYRILVKRGRPKANPWGFLFPLAPEVWLGLCFTFGLAIVALAMAYLSSYDPRTTTGRFMVVLVSCWDQFAILMNQTLSRVPEGWSSKVVVGLWLMAVMVIMRSYSGALTSLLAVRNIPIRINSLRDLVDAKEYKLIFEASTAMTAYMKEAKGNIFAELEQATQEGRSRFRKPFELFLDAYTVVRTEDYALLVEETTIRKVLSDDFSNQGRCDYFMAKETYFPLIFCIIGRYGLHLMPFINFKIQSLVEQDLYSTWLGEELNNMTACLRAPTSITVNEPYNMRGMWGVFILLTGGLIMSLVAFGCEVAMYWGRVYAAKQQELKDQRGTLVRPVSATSVWF